MKRIIWLVALLLAFVPATPVAAETILPPLVFREAKLKGEDFIVLQATVDDVKLDEYWLGYDSSKTLDTIEPEHRLAMATLQKDEAVLLVNDDAVPTCDALYTMDMPFDLAETKGTVGLWHREGATTAKLTYNLIDSFSWTTTASGKADIVRPDATEKNLGLPVWFRELDKGSTAWRIGDLQYGDEGTCTLKTASGTVSYTATVLVPPVVEEETETMDSTVVATTIDLAYPQITELLPNPSGTGNDSTDEFIELYNMNAEPFPLDGYVLQTGTTTLHSYTFPSGTALAPGYSVFYASDTGLSMSNTSGQARLLDPAGQIVAETTAYDGADDGTAWALAEGTWKWTTSPTPGAANVIAQAVRTAAKTAVKSATTKKTTAKTAAAKKTTTKTTKAKTTAASKGVASEATQPVRGIHPLVLVGILLAAVGYGVYEHRQDLANALYQFRSNRTARRSHRK